MIPIYGTTREETWLKAIEHLMSEELSRIEYDLILEVSSPASSSHKSKLIRQAVDQMLASANLYSVHTVAETIFPAKLYKAHGLRGVTEVYPDEIYPIIKRPRCNSKGTYAYRIVRGINAKGEGCCPLEGVIERLKVQLGRADGNVIRCAYELAVDSVQSIPINRNDSFYMGFPCLSHLSFKLSRDRSEIHLTAIYRSQDYIQKALGNLLGLARLQACVAREVGVNSGKLICHSTLARLDTHTTLGVRAIRKLIDEHQEL